MLPTLPQVMKQPFANSGSKNIIPEIASAESGLASLKDGFPAITEQPIINGGLPPQRQDFNGILFWLSNFAFWAQSGGLFTWQDSIDYPVPAMVMYNNVLYVCKKANGPTQGGAKTPGTDANYWVALLDYIGAPTKKNIEDELAAAKKELQAAIEEVKKSVTSAVALKITPINGKGSGQITVPINCKGFICFQDTNFGQTGKENGTHTSTITLSWKGGTSVSLSSSFGISHDKYGHSETHTGSDIATFTANIAAGTQMNVNTTYKSLPSGRPRSINLLFIFF